MTVYRSLLLALALLLCTVLRAQEHFVFTSIDCKHGLSENRVRNILQLKDGRLVITTEGVTNIFDGSTFKHLHLKGENISQLSGYSGFQHGYVDEDKVWFKNYRQLMIVDIKNERFFTNPDSVLNSLGVHEPLADFMMDAKGNHWFITRSDKLLLRIEGQDKTIEFHSHVSTPMGEKDELLDIASLHEKVYLFYRSGLMVCYDVKSRKEQYHSSAFNKDESYSTLMVVQSKTALFLLWNGYMGGKLVGYDVSKRTWTTLLKKAYWLNTLSIDPQGHLWVSCQKGMWFLDKGLKMNQFIESFKLVDGTVINTEASTQWNDDQGGLWIGTFNHGLLYYHVDRFKFKNFGKVLFQVNANDLNVTNFAELEPGRILVGTNQGVYQFLEANATLKRLTMDRLEGQPQFFRQELLTQELRQRIDNLNKQYNCIFEDSKKNVWIGTQDGLFHWQPASKELHTFFTDNGLINNSVKGVVEDQDGRIWVTTAGGVSRIVAEKRGGSMDFSIANFNHFDGVIENEFLNQSVFLSRSGTIYLGGINGFNIMNPKKSWVTSKLGKPLFTNLLLFGETIRQGKKYGGRVLLEHSVTTTDQIVLSHNQNFISLVFSALNYVNPTQTYYRYLLEGVDDDWREIQAIEGTGKASYTNLAPGTYVFKVKAANNSKEWSNICAEMVLVVKPPFWKTPLAYFLYVLLIFTLVYVALSYYKRWTHRQMARKNEEKLNEMKFNFFTNVSHEFRTPLTLILTPMESLVNEIKDSTLAPRLRNIYLHALNLKNLVDQLLDFRRLEITGEKLHLTFGNLVEFVQLFDDQFGKLAQEKNVTFTITSDMEDLFIHFDKDKMYKILNNLLSNAFKFTPKGGSVRIQTSIVNNEQGAEMVQVEVSDTGTGVAPEDIPLLFNRFYQASDVQGGSGIGLHLVKEYVLLHSGEVSVESEPNVRTVFQVRIPTNLKAVSSANTSEMTERVKPVEPLQAGNTDERYKLLIVEDHPDLRGFLVESLSKTYDILEAADGEAGVVLAKAESPHLIISDVLMPKMSGLELCKSIKSDLNTSHIPVILLTARSTEEHKIEGYQSGADEYLSKPFSLEILMLRVAALIEQDNQRKKSFSQKLQVNPKEITITSIDEQLIQKALNCIEENMDNGDYSVQQFSLDMGMDRTVLYKKLQSITGLPPSDFIRSIRLKRAAFLLLNGQLPVNEVADKVGFSSAKYFGKYFRETFGVPPSQYAKTVKGVD